MDKKDLSDETTRTDWSDVDEIVVRSEQAVVPVEPETALEPLQEKLEEPRGIIASYKANKIKEKAALGMMNEYHDAQLEVAKDVITKAVIGKKADSQLNLDKYLTKLNKDRIDNIRELDMHNFNANNDAIVELFESTKKSLAEIQSRDWPAKLKEKAMNGVWDNQEKLYKKIQEDMTSTEKD